MVLKYDNGNEDIGVLDVNSVFVVYTIPEDGTVNSSINVNCSNDNGEFNFVFDGTVYTVGDEITEATAHLLTLDGFSEV